MYNEKNRLRGKKWAVKIFTQNEIKILTKNKYVKNVSPKGSTYTDEFKHIFIIENENGKFPREIFEEQGFDINILGIGRVKASGNRWRTSYKSFFIYIL